MLTFKQAELLAYLVSFHNEIGTFPTYRRIARDMNKSLCSVHVMIGRLAAKGYVVKQGKHVSLVGR